MKHKQVYMPFEEAKAWVKALGLRNDTEWYLYCKGYRKDLPPRPINIPSTPCKAIYPEYKGMKDFLGTDENIKVKRQIQLYYPLTKPIEVIPKNIQPTYRTYSEALKYVHSLKLNSSGDWQKFCRYGLEDKSGIVIFKPKDIPSNPLYPYRKNWVDWKTWIGPTHNHKRLVNAWHKRQAKQASENEKPIKYKVIDLYKVKEQAKVKSPTIQVKEDPFKLNIEKITEFLKPKNP